MSEVKFGTIGGIEPSKIQKIKLNVMDYIFNYKGIDLNRAYLEYYFDKMKTVNYKDGIKQEEKYTSIIFFDITAQLNNKEYSFSSLFLKISPTISFKPLFVMAASILEILFVA